MVLGDSFAEGQGVKEADTLARVLERLLEKRAPGRYEVRNCGRRGTDFPELFEAFEDVLAYEPDLVIYTLTLNDAVQPPEFRARQSFVNDWILDRTHAPDAPEAVPSLFRPRVFDFVKDRVDALAIGRETTRCYLDMWSDANRAGLAEDAGVPARDAAPARRARRAAPGRALAALRRPRARLSVRAGPRHDPPLLPGGGHPAPRPAAGRSRAAAQPELWVHPVDHHPNEIAHRLAAEALVPEVLKLAPP